MSLIVSITCGLAVLALLFKPLFGTAEGFWECVKFWLRPDILSAFRGEFWDDWWAEMKLFVWLGLGGTTAWSLYAALS